MSAHGAEATALATLPRRLAAFGLDYLIVSLYIAALSLLGFAASGSPVLERILERPLTAQLFGFALLTLPVVLYFAVSEGSARQATPGKRVLGLRVATVLGDRLPWSRSLLRSALKFLPWEIAHTCLWRIPGWPGAVEQIPTGVEVGLGVVWILVVVYLLMPLVSRLRQTPYDRAAGSIVVDVARSTAP